MHRQSEKRLLSSNISSTCSRNMVNFGPLAAEICWRVWGTCKFQRVSRLGSVTARHSSIGRQPKIAAFSRGRHLYSPGRPSRWALVHTLVMAALRSRCGHYIFALWFLSFYRSIYLFYSSPNLSGRRLDVYHTSTHGVALVRI